MFCFSYKYVRLSKQLVHCTAREAVEQRCTHHVYAAPDHRYYLIFIVGTPQGSEVQIRKQRGVWKAKVQGMEMGIGQ